MKNYKSVVSCNNTHIKIKKSGSVYADHSCAVWFSQGGNYIEFVLGDFMNNKKIETYFRFCFRCNNPATFMVLEIWTSELYSSYCYNFWKKSGTIFHLYILSSCPYGCMNQRIIYGLIWIRRVSWVKSVGSIRK